MAYKNKEDKRKYDNDYYQKNKDNPEFKSKKNKQKAKYYQKHKKEILTHQKEYNQKPEDYSTSKKRYDIHHIKPLFTFNFVNPNGSTNLKEVQIAFAPENHILLTKEEHKEIHRKLNHNLLK